MNCPRCGSDSTGPRCSVCGQRIDATALDASDSNVVLAGWWRRVGATFADGLILFLPTYLATILVQAVAGTLIAILAGLAIEGAYMIYFLSSPSGQTVGNRVAATRVRDALSGHTITRQQAAKRWGLVAVYTLLLPVGGVITYAAFVLWLIDILSPLFNPRKQTLHDRFAGSIVVRI